MQHPPAIDTERLALENPATATAFSNLSRELQLGRELSPDQVRAWCHAGLELGHAALVHEVCRQLLQRDAVHPALRPYWLFFQGGALLHQFRVEEGVGVLRQALEALCNAPLVYNPQPRSTRFENPRIEAQLWQTLAALAAADVRAFAHAGTLLGLVRENRLLPFDKDLDLAMMLEDLPRAHAVLLARGWRRPAQPFTIDNLATYHHPQTDVILDLCGLRPEGDGTHLLGGFWINQGAPPEIQRLTRFPGPLQLAQAAGPAGMVWRLQDPQTWLQTMYGDGWRIPDPGFDTIIGTHNLVGFSWLTQWYACSRITGAWLNGYWEKALRLTRTVLERHTPEDPLFKLVAVTLEANLSRLKA
ncbi:MAG: LicD family protein [Noviherbaspirillum sp.]